MQKGEYLRRLTVPLQHARFPVPEHAEVRVVLRLELLSVEELIVAHSQEDKVVGHQPLKESDRLGDFAREQRGWVARKLIDQSADLRQHRPPVGNGTTNFFQHFCERCDDSIPLSIFLDVVEVKMDEAFATLKESTGTERDQAATVVARNIDHRMRDKLNCNLAFRELGQDGGHQKRHIIVDDLQDRNRVSPVPLTVGFAR